MEKHLNDEIKISLKEHYLNYITLPERPKKEIDVKLFALRIRKRSNWKPPINHPWRMSFIHSKKRVEQAIQVNKIR